jgi:hypothetical protein
MAPPAPVAKPGGRRKVLVLVVVAVVLVAALSIAAYVLFVSGPGGAATLVRVDVTASKTSVDQRDAVILTATAVDSANADRTASASITWSATPAGRVTLSGTTGPSITATALEAGTVTFNATADLAGVVRSGTRSVVIAALHFEVTASNPSPFLDAPFDLTVSARRSDSTIVTAYAGEVQFSTVGGASATLPPNTMFQTSDNGAKTFTNVQVHQVGPVEIVVEDTQLSSITGSVTVTGTPPPGAPTPSFTALRTLMHVDVDAGATTDPENDITMYEWDFTNDGTFDVTNPAPTVTAAFDYDAAGLPPNLYTIRLRVTDATNNRVSITRQVTVAPSTIDYEFFDFFNVPFGEWWDYRTAVYGDLPINAECFNATAIANGVCTASNANVDDTSSYPYTNWYPAPGAIQWFNPNANPLIYAAYRFEAVGDNVTGYNTSEPVFLPVLNYGETPGTGSVTFDWRMQYLDTATADAFDARGCGVGSLDLDGFQIGSVIQLTMDLQASRRLFGVVAADATAAQAWWTASTNPDCFFRGAVEDAVFNWFVALGGSASAVGKYDIYNSFEWFYQPYFVQITGTVDPDGTTHVTIETVAWGTEVLLARIFYWGNASYQDHYLDSTKARGWWGMELGWFEDFAFTGTLRGSAFDFNLASVMHYHFQQLASPGSDGYLNQVGDVPYWRWGPVLTDYTNDASARHLLSELDRYPNPPYADLHSTPGGSNYNETIDYETVPIKWDLAAGQTWLFTFPTSNVVFYDPNTTPVPANPRSTDYDEIAAPLEYRSTKPANYGTWTSATGTWELLGPASTGGPVGSPGPNGMAGDSDDQYALESWAAIRLVYQGAPASPPLAGSSAVESSPRTSAPVPSDASWSPQANLWPQRLRGSRAED